MIFRNTVGLVAMISNKIMVVTDDYQSIIIVKDMLLIEEFYYMECDKLIKLEEWSN